MTRFQSGYAKLVARLVADLVSLSREVVAEEREKLRAAQAAERKKAPRVSPRLQRALERAEAERKRAAERRAQGVKARAERSEKRRPELALISLFLGLLLVVASAAMYQAENEAQPELFSSVPATMWWTITTLTTVGYGDMYPITPWGRALGGAISLLGIGFFALPAGILAAAFAEELANKRRGQGVCPECGQAMPPAS